MNQSTNHGEEMGITGQAGRQALKSHFHGNWHQQAGRQAGHQSVLIPMGFGISMQAGRRAKERTQRLSQRRVGGLQLRLPPLGLAHLKTNK